MSLKKWAVIDKATGLVISMHEQKPWVMETCEPLINVEFDGIDSSDAPDYCDSFISYAEKEDGTPLTDEELDSIPSDVAYDYLMKYFY